MARIDAIHKAVHRIMVPYGTATVFAYLIRGDRIALVDTGASPSPKDVLEPALRTVGLALSDVELILNTHAHLDHSGGNSTFKRVSHAQIYVHKSDLPMAGSTEIQVEAMMAPLRALEFPREAIEQRAQYVRTMAGEAVGADVTLSDGDSVDLGKGIQLTVLHSPGHSPGSVCYYWGSEGVLFTGDAVQGQGWSVGVFPYYFNAPDYRRSVGRLSGLDFKLLCSGHAHIGGSVINDPSRFGDDARAFVAESIRVADTIHRVVARETQRMAGATKREIALKALAELLSEVPQLIDPQTRLPSSAAPTLVSHIETAISGTYPA